MREARLVGLSQDGKQLIVALAETGEEFAVPVDDRLRAALRGDRARLGQLEIQMESALRPRDIQARIRAGESPEAVAAIAQMPMERVMAFAGPVLAERDHIASLAQRASVRRRGGGDAPTRNLGAWVTDRLRTRQVDPASAEWDAWRREDGRWAVRVSYFVESEDEAEQKEEKIAMFAYDAPGRYAVPDDDESRWLVGEQAQVIATPMQPQPGERRLAAVADIDPLLAPDHGADSYEAGFEDTVGLRRRNHPASRDDAYDQTRETGRGGREDSRDFGRDGRGGRDARDDGREFGTDARGGREDGRESRQFGRDARGGREFGSDTRGGREDGRDARGGREDGRDVREFGRGGREDGRDGRGGRESSDDGRDSGDSRRDGSREFPREAARQPERGPRRVHSVPNPDEEPTLIDVPVDQPPAPRPAVRAVERPADPPAFASPAADDRPAERPAATTEARRPEPAPEPEPTAPAAATTSTRSAPASAPTAKSAPRATPAPTGEEAVEKPAEDAEQASTEEPKKKPAKRGKRASVPSWDEIMFGKKAD